MTESFYSILEISKSASQSDIKQAYRKLAVKFHPVILQQCIVLRKNLEQFYHHRIKTQITFKKRQQSLPKFLTHMKR
jgi:DnaJ-class molecular chaperone